MSKIQIDKNKYNHYGVGYIQGDDGNINDLDCGSCNSFVRRLYTSQTPFRLLVPSMGDDVELFKQWLSFCAKCGFVSHYIDTIANEEVNPQLVPAMFSPATHMHVVELNQKDLLSPHHAMATWTVIRYYFSAQYSYITPISLLIKKQYPKLGSFRCLMLAHYLIMPITPYFYCGCALLDNGYIYSNSVPNYDLLKTTTKKDMLLDFSVLHDSLHDVMMKEYALTEYHKKIISNITEMVEYI